MNMHRFGWPGGRRGPDASGDRGRRAARGRWSHGCSLLVIPPFEEAFRMKAALPVLLLAALLPLPGHAARPVDEDPFNRALRLAPLVLKESCPPYLLRTPGASFIEAPIACDAFLTSALVSMS